MNENERKKLDRLRLSAEALIQKREKKAVKTDDRQLERLLYDFEIHQAELEIQNEELRRSAAELEAARNEFYDLFEAAPIGFIIIDAKGFIQRCNRAAGYILSGSRTPMAGKLFSSMIHPQDMNIYFSYLKSLSLREKTTPRELRIMRKDSDPVYVHLEASAVHTKGTPFNHWRLALVDITERKAYETALKEARDALEDRVRDRTAELEMRSRQLARLSNELTLAEQKERKRLAALIHDDLQQLLTGAKLHLEILARQEGLQDRAAFQQSYTLIMESVKTARSLSSELSPPILYQKGLCEALNWLSRWMQETYRLDVTVNLVKDHPRLPEEIRILLFHSVRELLFNVVKHANSTSARVDVHCLEGRVRISVCDSGVGFNPADLNQDAEKGGFGLFSIRERLELLGGSFDIQSKPDGGTIMTLSLPLTPDTYRGQERRTPFSQTFRRASDTLPKPARPAAGSKKIRIMLADDHAVMRNGLSSLLSGYADIEIVGEATHGKEAVEMARKIHPDVILMDINMPHMNGVDATRHICMEMPDIRVIGLSMHDAEDQAAAMKAAGAVEYLNKGGQTDQLLAAIRQGPVVTP